jgi:hypothetical protein
MEYPFNRSCNYLGVIFGNRITLRLHKEVTEAKAYKAFIRMNSIFECEHLNANIKLTLHKALIKLVMTYFVYYLF